MPRIFGYNNTEDYTVENPLVKLGKIIAVDIFLNNSDRVPSIWNHPGNEANIMFQVRISP
jgi:hypothetical protein